MGTELEPLLLLRDVTTYRQKGLNTFDYSQKASESSQAPTKCDWIEMYRHTIPGFQQQAAKDSSTRNAEKLAATFAAKFSEQLDAYLAENAPQQPTTAGLCALREEGLRQQGFGDVYKTVKFEENVKAIGLLPDLLRELDQIEDAAARLDSVLRGVFAGNVFDLGAPATTAAFNAGQVTFAQKKLDLLPRPWIRDDIDRVIQRWQRQPHKKALIFVDNAGSDFVLGILPLVRELLRMGTIVVLAANSIPSINDITIQELEPLLHQAGHFDSAFGAALSIGRLRAVGSGSGLPVIDLSQLSPEVNKAAQGVDLVVLEGMGRGIETNLNAEFKCDALNLGMVKHPEVAAGLQGRMYDIVCQYKPVDIA